MSKEQEKKSVPNGQIAAKAGLWYTVCNILFKGMAFLTAPIFTRLLSKQDLGSFNNFASWLMILAVITAMDLQTSIIRSKLEHNEDMDSYIWSILSLTSLVTLVLYGIVCVFHEFFMDLFQMDMACIHLLFAYLLLTPAYQMYITWHRAYYRYKKFVVMTGISMLSSTLLSLALVLILENKMMGRIVGQYLPPIVMGLLLYVLLAVRGRRIKVEYWKYACIMCVPLVPHLLSLYLLGSSDKILITKLCGAEFTAIYSVAYTCYHIVSILFDSMNKAWAPWLLEQLHNQNYSDIQKTSKIYILLFVGLEIGLLLLAPEVIWILGGKRYHMAVYCMPPLISGCLFQFVYTMYVNIEFYKKKTIGVAPATITATILNILLNLIFIPMFKEYSYVVAAYTTMIGYIVLFAAHYYLVRRMDMAFVYDIKFVGGVLGGFLVFSLVTNLLYQIIALRYALVLVYGACILYLLVKYREYIVKIVFSRKKKRAAAERGRGA